MTGVVHERIALLVEFAEAIMLDGPSSLLENGIVDVTIPRALGSKVNALIFDESSS